MANVSVVIPCYRCKKSIERAVHSIADQKMRPREVILIDDASGDGTLELLHEIAKRHAGWINVISLCENVGAASARNAGWDLASQPYIAFLDSDDTWHPEKIRIQYEYMLANRSVVISGHRCDVFKNQDDCFNIPSSLNIKEIKPFLLVFKNYFSTPTVMLKREISFRFAEDKRLAEDFYLWQQIAFDELRIVRIELSLAYVYKKFYGESGLSAQLWEMEKAELDNFSRLYKVQSINWVVLLAASFFSIIKFCKRVILVSMYKIPSLLCRSRRFLCG